MIEKSSDDVTDQNFKMVQYSPSPEILRVNRQFICNISSSRSFLPQNRSRPFLSHIYSI